VEQEATRRLATIRLIPPGERERGVVVDLLFASSGIEREIVAGAQVVEVMAGLSLARSALTLITERRFNRGRDLLAALEQLRATPPAPGAEQR